MRLTRRQSHYHVTRYTHVYDGYYLTVEWLDPEDEDESGNPEDEDESGNPVLQWTVYPHVKELRRRQGEALE